MNITSLAYGSEKYFCWDLLAVKNSTRATEDLVIVRRPNDDDDDYDYYYYYYYYYVSVWSLQALLNRSFSDF